MKRKQVSAVGRRLFDLGFIVLFFAGLVYLLKGPTGFSVAATVLGSILVFSGLVLGVISLNLPIFRKEKWWEE